MDGGSYKNVVCSELLLFFSSWFRSGKEVDDACNEILIILGVK